MMGTRAAAFAGKVSNLRDATLRIQNNTMPQPTCIDLANMLRYFCQVFHDFRDFKDIENIPLYSSEKKDRLELIKTLPNFDYSGLYKTLAGLVDILSLIPQPSNGYEQLCTNLLLLFKCLVPFLDQANMETMPYLVSTLFISYPQSMHKMILDTLCFNLLPFTIDQQQRNNAKMIRKATRKLQNSSPRPSGNENQPTFHCIVRIEEDPSGQTDEQTSLLSGQREVIKSQGKSEDEDQGIVISDERANDSEEEQSWSETDENEYAMLSVTSILMVSLHYMQEPMHHSQLIECLMKLKSNVFEDLLYVIAYGTTRARCPAVEMLFRYWPDICPTQADLKTNQTNSRLKHVPWQPIKCQNKNCSSKTLEDDEAVKMCIDFRLSIILSGAPPPMLVCLDCVDSIYRQQSDLLETPVLLATTSLEQEGTSSFHQAHSQSVTFSPPVQPLPPPPPPPPPPPSSSRADQDDCIQAQIDIDYSNKFLDLLLPMQRVSKLCENKKCKSTHDKVAVGTCFDIECANYNGKKPIRYCKNCYLTMHEPCAVNNYDMTLQNHIRHSSLNFSIMENDEAVNNFVEAIISLLKEAEPVEKASKDSDRHLRLLMGPTSQFSMDNKEGRDQAASEGKQPISQYGIWLMTGLCKSVERLSDELLGRLLGMLFQWFEFTACLPNDETGSALEKLKGDCIRGWIMEVKKKRLDVFISCLLPHPIDCSKIGGHWEVWPDNAHQIKEGFKCLKRLLPYDIITDDVWNEIMPHWMECFRHEVPENELSEPKLLEAFDIELSPSGFKEEQMYKFIISRFEDTANTNQEQPLYWLQIITMLEIPIPINFLFQMLRTCVESLAQIRAEELSKIKMVGRLKELEERARRSNEQKKAKQGDESDSSDDDGSNSSTMSVAEDDVMMPSEPAGSKDGDQRARELSRQERQAQARAAFSAKLFQAGSALDAQHTGVPVSADSSQVRPGTSSTSATQLSGPSAGSSRPQIQFAPPKSHTTSSLAPLASGESTPGTSLMSLSPAGQHSKPLRSTSKDGTTNTKRTEAKKSSKPKLKLNVESVEDEDSEFLNLNKIDNNLVCYILMMDILLKQLDLYENQRADNSPPCRHGDLDSEEAQQAIELLNSIISTPWLGKHTCCDSLPYTSSSSPASQQASSAGNAFMSSIAQAQQQQKTGTADSSSSSAQATAGGIKEQANMDSSSRQDVFYSNIHSFSHCAQGFEQEDSYETCVFCEVISTFFQLSMSLIEFFSKKIEVSICEVSQDAANDEFDGKPDYSRIGLDHLGPSPKEQNIEFDFDHAQASLQRQQAQQDPTSPFSPNYSGATLKPEVLESLPKVLQLTYNLLVQFHQYQTPDIVSRLLQMIKLVSLHSQVLSKAAKEQPQFISWCQHNMLINKLWSLCQLESSEIARTCVPLLLHCITLPWGVRLFRDLVERDFNSDNWLARFRAVERVVTIAHFCEQSTIKSSPLLQSTMASAFCYVVRCLDDIEAIVAQRALVSLEMMKTSSLKLLLWCLEVQFDCIIVDRSIILRSVFQLYNHLRDRRFLTWDFFLSRFDTIFLEAQIFLQQTGEIPSFTMQDLKNTNTKSEIYRTKIARAREALQGTHNSRSLLSRFQEARFTSGTSAAANADADAYESGSKQSLKLQQQLQRQQQADSLGADLNTSNATSAERDRKKAPWPMKRVLQHGKSTSSRYQTIALLTSQSLAKRKNSKFMSNLAMQSVPPLMSLPDKLHQHLPNSFVDDGSKLNEIAQENHVFGVVHRVCDEDRDTNHALVFLLMQFFSKPDPSHPQSIKMLNQRSHLPVLKHLSILMGYSVARKNFLISASNLRLLPVFNAFLTSLPKVLDFNYTLGGILLDTCLPVLIYCPAQDSVHFDSLRRPNYSLWLLNPLMRQNWLMSVLTFLYKYQFNQPHLEEQVNQLIWIIINTLETHLNTTLADVVIPQSTATASAHQPSSGPTISATSEVEPASHKTQLTRAGASESQLEEKESAIAREVAESPRKVIEVHSAGSSPKATVRKRAFESIEMHSVKEDAPAPGSTAITSSASSASLKQKTTAFSTISPKPIITKADTTDNLTTKSKFFHQSGSASKAPISPSATRGVSTKSTGPIEPATGEERLLPIGAGGTLQRSRQQVGQPNERLLPIGYGPTITQVPAVISKDTQTSPVTEGPLAAEMQTTTKKQISSKSTAAELSQKNQSPRPLQGLRGNVTQALIHVPSDLSARNKKSRQKDDDGATTITAAPMSTTSSKAARLTGGRFGASKQSSSETRLFQMTRQQEQQEQLEQQQAGATSGSGGAKSAIGTLVSGGRKNKLVGKFGQAKEYVPKQLSATAVKQNFSSPSLLNEQLAQLNRHSCIQEFSDKDLSMCLVILETFIHHEPSMAAQMLPNILRLVARYSSSSFESWQTGSNAHLVGGSMFVARQFIRVALHDLMENNIFHQIFTSHFTGYEFYKSMSTALADFTDLNQLAPLSKLFEDLNKQKNLPSVSSLMTILENVATYFHCITQDSPAGHSRSTWDQFIENWEAFLRKLILNLPRFSTENATNRSSTSAQNNKSCNSNTSDGGASAPSDQLAGNVETIPSGSVGLSGAQGGSTITGSKVGAASASPNSPLASGADQQATTVLGGAGSKLQGLGRHAGGSSCSMIMAPIMRIILATSKVPHLASCKTILDPYSKIISYTVLNSRFKYEHLLEINHNCCRLYARDKKYLIQRSIAYELVQVLKFRFLVLEENLLLLLLFVLQDVGGALPTKVLTESLKIDKAKLSQADSYVTNVSECLRQHMGDLLEFVTDVHAISRINDNLIGSRPSSINRDSFGGHVKAAISQYLALEISLSHSGDQRTIARYLPWLYNSPTLQQGPREFIDCVSHIRQLSWLILGSLQHSALVRDQMSAHATGSSGAPMDSQQQQQQQQQQQAQLQLGCAHQLGTSGVPSHCQPIPIEKNSNIAEHVQVVLAGFAEQSKESVLHMSSLYNAFLLCQLWTMYCEHMANQHPANSEQHQYCQSTLDEFWAKITPGVLRLVGHSRMMSDMVSSHFLQLIESLIESESSILIRYLPMWNSIFYSYRRRNKSSIQVAIRLQKCFEWQPPGLSEPDLEQNRRRFTNWLEKIQYKMSHIEIQSSQATPYYLS